MGSWIGTRSSPWTPTEKVAVTFEADGHGVDDDLPAKRYAVSDIFTDGGGGGDIVVAFSGRRGVASRVVA